jgi:hypothetical protein
MELDYMTAPVFDEHGNAEYDEDVHEFIASMIGDTNEEEQYFDAHEVEGGPAYEDDYYCTKKTTNTR